VERPSSPDPELLAAFRRTIRLRIERELAIEASAGEQLRAELLPMLRTAVAAARAEGLATHMILFGSFAAGVPNEQSDVDLLVDGCANPLRLSAVVGAAIGREVHAVTRESAPPSLLARVEAEGIPL